MVWQGETTMMVLLPSYNPNRSHSYENNSIDVVRKGCFRDFDTVACIRNGLLTFLAVLTGLLCVIKLVRLHYYHHPAWHQYFIFYCATLECIVATVHWVLGRYAELDFILQYLKLLQFLVMCHFYCTMATRVLRKETLTRRFLIPVLVAAFAYFSIIVVLGIVYVKGSWVECLQPYWVALSAAEFLLVQLFMVAGFYITRRLNEISTLDSVRWQQKRDLWCIIMVFEFSAFSGLVYDFMLQILGDDETGCSGIFLHIQELYSAIFVIFMVIKLLLPMWVMLCVFHPLPPASDQEDLLPALSEDGTYTSVFSPTVDDQQYRQLYHPTEDYRSTDDSPSPNGHLPPTSSRTSLIHRTPSLTPIKEETNSNPKNIVTPKTATISSQSATPTPNPTPLPSSIATTPEYRPPPKGTFYL